VFGPRLRRSLEVQDITPPKSPCIHVSSDEFRVELRRKTFNLLLFALSVVESFACAGPVPVWAELAWFWPAPPPELPPEDILKANKKTKNYFLGITRTRYFGDFTIKSWDSQYSQKTEKSCSFNAERFATIDNHELCNLFGIQQLHFYKRKWFSDNCDEGCAFRSTK